MSKQVKKEGTKKGREVGVQQERERERQREDLDGGEIEVGGWMG